ncbi:MAG TPA: ATP synthase F1 subunit delta [Firmicutes bacterium]|nr:ATP synthase F1 subunit delta [Bacillota bacterium]
MSKIASTYATALFDIALEANILEDVKSDFDALVKALNEEKQIMDILRHPKIDKKEKKSLLNLAFSTHANKMLVNFIMLLIDKDRIENVFEMQVTFNELVNTHLGITEGTVYSAVALTEAQLQQLTDTFTKKLNQKVQFNTVIDSSLIAGYKVNLNNMVYDNSVKLQLKNLKNNLMNVELK